MKCHYTLQTTVQRGEKNMYQDSEQMLNYWFENNCIEKWHNSLRNRQETIEAFLCLLQAHDQQMQNAHIKGLSALNGKVQDFM